MEKDSDRLWGTHGPRLVFRASRAYRLSRYVPTIRVPRSNSNHRFFPPLSHTPAVPAPELGLDVVDGYPPQGSIPIDSSKPTSSPSWSHIDIDPEFDIDTDLPPLDADPFRPTSPSPSTAPTSPETDPDPAKTVHCTAPYAPHLPLVQYALMIDAGSTGSRIHVYKFHHCGPSPGYEYEVFAMTQPGLSAYSADKGGTPEAAAASLDVLLDEAVRVVPGALQGCTPVAVKATAGLRLLGAEESGRMVEAVEARLRGRYPFRVVEGGVGIMDGSEEGVYAWMTVNYLMGRIRAGEGGVTDSEAGGTYAVLDLGGGSTQIVFEPETSGEVVLREGEHRYALVVEGEERVLYQHSYLGYGLKSARESVHRVVEFMDGLRAVRASEGALRRVVNPCLAQGTTKEVDVPVGEDKVRVLMTGEDVGNFDACNRVLELVMAKDA